MEEIYREFKIARQIDLSIEEFQILVLSYPIFKVAKADGDFDEEESQLLTEILTNFFNEIFGENLDSNEQEKLAQLFIEDLIFLDSNKDKFEKPILHELSSFTSEIKSSVFVLLNQIAEISNGKDEKEEDIIKYLSENYLS